MIKIYFVIERIIIFSADVHLEGIFRVNGSKKRINDLKSILDTQGNLIDWENQESFTVSRVTAT